MRVVLKIKACISAKTAEKRLEVHDEKYYRK